MGTGQIPPNISVVLDQSEAVFRASCDVGMTFPDGSAERRVNCTCETDDVYLLNELTSLSECQGTHDYPNNKYHTAIIS